MISHPTNNNDHTPLSMKINPGFDRDPLKPKTHHVVVSNDGGKSFFVLGKPGQQFITDAIELLKIEVGGQHALGMPGAEVRIMNEDREEVARFESYHVEPQEGPPSDERLKIRDRWLDAIMQFLLPPSLYALKDDPKKKDRLARWFRSHKIEISMRPDGGAVCIYREGNLLSSWGC